MATGLLKTHAERTARMEAKRFQILRFLREEIYTTREVVQVLLGVAPTPAKQTLAAMARDGLIRLAEVQTADASKFHIWGITAEGQAMAFNLETEQPNEKYFEPGRVGLTVLRHTLFIQLARLAAEKKGFTNWQNGDRLAMWEKDQGRPDAILTSPSGELIAVEMELTLKTTKRYEDVLFDRLRQIKAGAFSRICWVCETAEKAKRLQAIINKIDSFAREYKGRKVDLKISDEHRTKFIFSTMAEWPNI